MKNIESFEEFVGEEGKKSPRTVVKRFSDADKANDYYLKLCDKYDSVQLVRSPRFSEDGEYAWEVSESVREGELVLKPAGEDDNGNQLYVAKGAKGYFVKVDGAVHRCQDDVHFEAGEKLTGKYRIEEGVNEARYTYEPTNFYAARTWSVDMATDADRAAYKKGYTRAQKLLADLVATLEGLPRVDQFEDIPDAIKALRELQRGRLGSAS